mgnify:CR=1 FL=1
MDNNNRAMANNPVWDNRTVSNTNTVAAVAVPEAVVIPAGAKYVIISPLVNAVTIMPTSVNAAPGVAVGAGGSFEIALGASPQIWIDASVAGTKVDATFFF